LNVNEANVEEYLEDVAAALHESQEFTAEVVELLERLEEWLEEEFGEDTCYYIVENAIDLITEEENQPCMGKSKTGC